LRPFLAACTWDEIRARNRLQEIVVRADAGPNAIDILDETSDVKPGDKTPGVKRQWRGSRRSRGGWGLVHLSGDRRRCSFRRSPKTWACPRSPRRRERLRFNESTIKRINRCVKGSEKFSSNLGAEALLQLAADYLDTTGIGTLFPAKSKGL
jgi:hypothetical protein